MKKREEDFLNYVFVKSPEKRWETDSAGLVTLIQENTGLLNRIRQKVLKKTNVLQLHMEVIGSYIWFQIDGEKTVYQIGQYLSDQFHDAVEPLYERLSEYMKRMESAGFIVRKKNT